MDDLSAAFSRSPCSRATAACRSSCKFESTKAKRPRDSESIVAQEWQCDLDGRARAPKRNAAPHVGTLQLRGTRDIHPAEPHEIHARERRIRQQIMPYRTADDVVDGLVITFVDIERSRREERAAEGARVFGDEVLNALPQGVAVLDHDLRVLRANDVLLGTLSSRSERLPLGQSLDETSNAFSAYCSLHTALRELISTGQPIYRRAFAADDAGASVRVSARRPMPPVPGTEEPS